MMRDERDLEEFAECGSESAFRRIVERHAPMVRGVAARMTRDGSLAEEVTQSVFIILARKAATLRTGNLPGWLHNAAVGESRNAVRKAIRRDRLNRDYMKEIERAGGGAEAWEDVAPLLDEAVAALPGDDRRLILLRFFESHGYTEISRALGCSEPACRKRCERALGRLAKLLGKRGVKTSTQALGAGMVSFALMPSTTSAAVISGSALASAASAFSTTLKTTTLPASKFSFGLNLSPKSILLYAMKPLHFILPAIALIGSAVWLYSQESPLRNLEESNRAIRGRIAKVDGLREKFADSVAHNSPGDSITGGEKHLLQDGSFNWIVIGKMVKKSEGSMDMSMGSDIYLLMQIKEEIMTMSVEELNAELAKFPKLELDDKIRQKLKMALIDGFVQNDPHEGFKMLADNLPEQTSQSWWKLKKSFSGWATKDPAAAAAWLDKMIATQGFQDKSLDPEQNSRFDLETEFMAAIIADNPELVAKRLAGFTPEERVAILQQTNVWAQRDGEVPKEFFGLVREFATAEERDRIIGDAVATSFTNGLENTSSTLKKHDLSPGERAEAIEQAVLRLSWNLGSGRGEVENIYPWLQKEDPDRAAGLTGKVLADISQRRDELEVNFERALLISEENEKREIVEAMMENLTKGDENFKKYLDSFKDESLKIQFETRFKEAAGSEGIR